MTKDDAEKKLAELRMRLAKMEGEEMEKITTSRIEVGMGDDYRENEAAKVVMEDHEFLHLRISHLKREIVDVKRHLIALRTK